MFDTRVTASPPLGRFSDSARFELTLEELDFRARELIERFQILIAGDAGVGDQQDAMLHVIERQHRIEQHEPGIVSIERCIALLASRSARNHAAVS
jgi:hypothetical protein